MTREAQEMGAALQGTRQMADGNGDERQKRHPCFVPTQRAALPGLAPDTAKRQLPDR